jgi:hypothetical protein
MQDKYVSLNPAVATTNQTFTDRNRMYQQRVNEARGGPYAESLGLVTGLTAATYFYARAQKHGFNGAFTRHNAGHYTMILGSAFIAYHIGSNWVAAVTGDGKQTQYLQKNKAKII